MICVVHAHPRPSASRTHAALLGAIRELDDVEVRSLYDMYPDADIDVAAEQQALARASLIVFQHPLYWYGVPGLMKLWFDEVLVWGWAYGTGSHALGGKDCLWLVSANGSEADFSEQGRHGGTLASYGLPLRQTARFCGMNWLAPFTVMDAGNLSDEGRRGVAAAWRERLLAWRAQHGAGMRLQREGLEPLP